MRQLAKIIDIAEQRIGHNNLVHGKDRHPQDRKLYNQHCRQLVWLLKFTSIGQC